MITYAGVALTEPTDPDVRDHLDRWWNVNADDLDHPGYFSPGLNRLPVPYPPTRRPARPGTLVWPSGASRWATFRGFVTHDQLAAIRTAVGSSPPAAKPLVIDDGDGGTLTADMWFLSARPVLQHEDGPGDYYLMTLADHRYWWWQHPAYDSYFATWANLIGHVISHVGATWSPPSIPSAYGLPYQLPLRWATDCRAVPPVLDAAVTTVGMRLVRLPATGAVVVGGPAAAATQDAANWAAFRADLLTGGRLSGADLARGLPGAVQVVFPGVRGGAGNQDTTRTRTLASLSLAAAGGVTGVTAAGAAARVTAGIPATGPSASQFDAYADQAAADYYGWLVSDQVDATFRGCKAWVPSGAEDRIEWVHSDGVGGDGPLVITRVVAGSGAADRSQYGDPMPDDRPFPDTPKNLLAAAGGSGEINLTWDVQSPGAGEYHVYYKPASPSDSPWVRAAPGSTIVDAGVGVNTYTLTGLTPGGSYAVAVAAVGWWPAASRGAATEGPYASRYGTAGV